MDHLNHIHGLGAGERIYFQPDHDTAQLEQRIMAFDRLKNPDVEAITIANKLRNTAPQLWETVKETRKAKRILDKKQWDQYQEEKKAQEQAEREQKKAIREANAAALKVQRQQARDIKRAASKEQKEKYKAPGDMRLKKIVPEHFEPIIKEPNTRGETPVQIDAKTTIYVPKGCDVQKSIAKWQDHLKNK